MRWTGRLVRAWVIVGAFGAVASAQEGEPGTGGGESQLEERLEALEPARRLGLRSAMALHVREVVAEVVVVRDLPSYVRAVGSWTREVFWPVLIDDGTREATENIARFVRAFEPRRVVRWSVGEGAAWPADEAVRRGEIEGALARGWGMEERAGGGELFGRVLKGAGLTPAGIVLASVDDPAWTGALALASGRAQPIAWISVRRGLGGFLDAEQAGRLERAASEAAEATGLSWGAPGDDIDAVTLCVNSPMRIKGGEGEFIATTDALGRVGADRTRRWAWVGQVPGDAQRAAYNAMSALFLSREKAWLFDGYPPREPFSAWDATKAGEVLRAQGMEVSVIDSPSASEAAWRRAASRALDADLVLVNTRGNRDFFDVEPGRLTPGDVPLLGVPSMVYMVHSWSAANLAARGTVGGRWIEHGAYAYFGSVQEPYLQAFVPTPALAARLAAGYPWGAAVRMDEGAPWRLTTYGDPLITISPRPARTDAALPLEGGVDLEEEMRESVREERFSRAIELLTMLGRDEDAAQLAAGLMEERVEHFTPEAARAGVGAFFRTGRHEELFRAFGFVGELGRAEAMLRDALWLAAGPRLGGGGAEVVGLLRGHLREEQAAEDAMAVAPAVARLFGPEAAAGLLSGQLARERSPRVRRELEAAIGRLR